MDQNIAENQKSEGLFFRSFEAQMSNVCIVCEFCFQLEKPLCCLPHCAWFSHLYPTVTSLRDFVFVYALWSGSKPKVLLLCVLCGTAGWWFRCCWRLPACCGLIYTRFKINGTFWPVFRTWESSLVAFAIYCQYASAS